MFQVFQLKLKVLKVHLKQMVHCSIPKDYLLLNFIPHSNLNSPISFFGSKKLRYAVTKVLAKDVLAPSKLLLLQLHWLLCIFTSFWELFALKQRSCSNIE